MHHLLKEYSADWRLSGRSLQTLDNYTRALRNLLQVESDVEAWDLPTVKLWLAEASSRQTARMRARAIRSFLKWAEQEGALECSGNTRPQPGNRAEQGPISDPGNGGPQPPVSWWRRIPLPSVEETPQETVTEDDYRAALARAKSTRDKALVATLWSSGLRRAEVGRMQVEHVDVDNGCVIVPITKTGRPRVAPLSPEACKYLRRYLRKCGSTAASGPLWLGERGPAGPAGHPRRSAPLTGAQRPLLAPWLGLQQLGGWRLSGERPSRSRVVERGDVPALHPSPGGRSVDDGVRQALGHRLNTVHAMSTVISLLRRVCPRYTR